MAWQAQISPSDSRDLGGTLTLPAVEIPGYVAGIWDLDPVHTHIGFVGRHLMLSKVRGRFDTFQGQIVTAADPLQSSATVTVDLNSVNTGDQTRDDDLRSANFFDVATYPTMTYRSTGIRRHGRGFIIDGELTVRGTTKPVSLNLEINGFAADPGGGARAAFSLTGEVNRLDFGVCPVTPIVGLASANIQIDIEAAAVLRNLE
jgi:polyisoprenoid-binding protein YceI